MNNYLIGIDIGTGGTKTVLFRENGATVCASSASYPLYQPRIGWAEQDPEDWWNAVVKTLKEVIDTCNVPAKEIAGIGLTGQMHGLVMLSGEGKPLRKSIIWCDQRTGEECREIESKTGAKRLIEITANPALTGFTAAKIVWVQKHEPEVYKRCKHILLPKDYIRYRLTGAFATDVSDASGMQLLNVSERRWSEEILNALHIPQHLLGKVYESPDITGYVTKTAAKITGLVVGTPVAGGAGDQAAAGVGNGIVGAGKISANIGTSGVVFAHTDQPVIDPLGRVHTFCHAVPGCWHVMGVTQGAGLSMKWFKDTFYFLEQHETDDIYSLINRQIASVPAGSEGLLYLPYLMGERTPHSDSAARGVFFGISAKHDRRHFARAVMEGVSYSLLDCLNVFRGMGITGNEVRISGGGAKSGIWRQMLSDMFGMPAAAMQYGEAGALGAAMLAGVAAGVYCNVRGACKIASVKERLSPQPASRSAYLNGFKLYQKLYPALKQSFQDLQQITLERNGDTAL